MPWRPDTAYVALAAVALMSGAAFAQSANYNRGGA
jgi:hypothetical protein